jgi:hypothetical protein
MKKKIIKFNVVDEVDYANIPLPSKKYMPKWYRELKPNKEVLNEKKDSLLRSIIKNKTAKKCVPFMDTFTSGYIFETWCDMEIIQEDNNFLLNWVEGDWTPIEERPPVEHFQVPEGYHQRIVSLKSPLFIKTPPGYSVLISQPHNRYDLPFLTLSGIVDTDIHPLFPGNTPLFIKKSFSGIVPKGTPIMQIIPFKRDSWQSIKDESLKKEGRIAKRMGLSVVQNWYKDNAWSKKSYE